MSKDIASIAYRTMIIQISSRLRAMPVDEYNAFIEETREDYDPNDPMDVILKWMLHTHDNPNMYKGKRTEDWDSQRTVCTFLAGIGLMGNRPNTRENLAKCDCAICQCRVEITETLEEAQQQFNSIFFKSEGAD